ncbi:hypothetical protein TNCT_21701 [Trichonephila clavata]|uniref:Secreted protein n=1 Tax=Trichonephila clavata TaxID=2740835 RepID=A0A8X6LS46_TRICU|nr:hypothetical protein TNCT_21701 [Trichonephila clavata]
MPRITLLLIMVSSSEADCIRSSSITVCKECLLLRLYFSLLGRDLLSGSRLASSPLKPSWQFALNHE